MTGTESAHLREMKSGLSKGSLDHVTFLTNTAEIRRFSSPQDMKEIVHSLLDGFDNKSRDWMFRSHFPRALKAIIELEKEIKGKHVAQIKEVTLKPEFKCIAEKRPECHNDEHYTERGTLLCLPEGPKYTYERDEIDGYLQVNLWNVVSAQCDAGKLTAANVYPLHNETLFKDIPEIDNLVSRLERAVELGNVDKAEFKRVMPIIKNQRIAHEILDEVCEKYGMKRAEQIKVHSRKCPYGGPVPSMERLDYTIFCYVGQNIYKSGEPGPYHGWRIFCIDFPGWGLIHELVKEKCFGKKSRQ